MCAMEPPVRHDEALRSVLVAFTCWVVTRIGGARGGLAYRRRRFGPVFSRTIDSRAYQSGDYHTGRADKSNKDCDAWTLFCHVDLSRTGF